MAALEQASLPYRRCGYRVFNQTDSSLMLHRQPPPSSIGVFILLLIVFWPAAIIYSVSQRNRRDDVVCLRATSQGTIEDGGDTFAKLRDEARRANFAAALLFAVIAVGGLAFYLILSGKASIARTPSDNSLPRSAPVEQFAPKQWIKGSTNSASTGRKRKAAKETMTASAPNRTDEDKQ